LFLFSIIKILLYAILQRSSRQKPEDSTREPP